MWRKWGEVTNASPDRTPPDPSHTACYVPAAAPVSESLSLPVGFVGVTLADWPGHVTSVLFLPGCDLRCPFCHNPELACGEMPGGGFPLSRVLTALEARVGFIDGVVVSGGEPSLRQELPELLGALRILGLLRRLDTHGLHPDRLEPILRGGLVTDLAVDVKTDPDAYGELRGPADARERLAATFALTRGTDVEVEARTTCAPGFVEKGRLGTIQRFLREQGIERWTLHRFRPEVTLDPAIAERQSPRRRDLARQLDSAGPEPHWRGW